MEYLGVYDENKINLGKKIARGDKLLDNEHILIALVFIENSDGLFLIHKTSIEKGSKYSSTGGHVLYGEDLKGAITRELQEELGLDVLSDELKFMGSMLLGIPFFDVYHLNKDIDVSKLNLQKEEVSEVSFMSKSEINELIDNDLMIKSHGISFRKFFN